MRYYPIRLLTIVCLGMLLAASSGARAELAGSAGRPTPYGATLTMKDGNQCELSIQVERVSFLLTAVGGKYRFVRMLVECRTPASLMLSSSADRLEVEIDKGKTIPGVLSLQRTDSALWDGLDANMRQTLAYPPAVKPGQSVYVFAFFPSDVVNTMPRAFSYTIASLGQTVTLQNRSTAA